MSSGEHLLLDEMCAPMLAEQLRAEGFDVVAVAGHATLAAASDGEVMRRWLKQPAGHAGPVDWLS